MKGQEFQLCAAIKSMHNLIFCFIFFSGTLGSRMWKMKVKPSVVTCWIDVSIFTMYYKAELDLDLVSKGKRFLP